MHCIAKERQRIVRCMTRRPFSNLQTFLGVPVVGVLLLCAITPAALAAEASRSAIAAFNIYVNGLESRLAQQHRLQDTFLALPAPASQSKLQFQRGLLIVEKMTPHQGAELPGALLHHWRGTAFAAEATAADFERLMRDIDGYPQYFSPQVAQAKVLAQQGDRMQAVMRVRQQHVITVVMDTTYDISYGRLDPRHGYSLSRSTRVSEIEAAGTAHERALNANEEHGFLWRLNTYWSYEERDGGLYMQVESVSLTRSIPSGLGWAAGPFVESVPRESIEFTLRSVCNALRK